MVEVTFELDSEGWSKFGQEEMGDGHIREVGLDH